jgi:hypothetical protein
MANNNPNPNVPDPAGAVSVGDWHGVRRYFTGQTWVVDVPGGDADVGVKVAGYQDANCRVHRWIRVDTLDAP